jgi:hypothetical protein
MIKLRNYVSVNDYTKVYICGRKSKIIDDGNDNDLLSVDYFLLLHYFSLQYINRARFFNTKFE